MTTRARWLVASAWLVAVGVGGVLVRARVAGIQGFGDPGFDFWGYYAPAARSLRSVGTPYTVDGYVYSPLISAVALAALATPAPLTTWTAVQLCSAFLAVGLALFSVGAGLRRWRAPVFVVVALLSLLWSSTTGLELALGQVELILLACLAAAMFADFKDRPGWAGAAIAAASVVKTWPAFAALWLFRRGMHARGRALFAGATTAALAAVVFVALLGPSVLGDWVNATRSGSLRPLLSYSAFGVGRDLFEGGSWFDPLVRAPGLRWVVTGFLVLVGLTLAGIVLWLPGDPRLALWHIVGCGLFLQPVSNLNYLVLLVPVVWIHAARLLDPTRAHRFSVRSLAAAGVVLAWWIVAHRHFDQSRGGYILTVVATVAMLATSILAEAVADRRSRGQTTTAARDRMGRVGVD